MWRVVRSVESVLEKPLLCFATFARFGTIQKLTRNLKNWKRETLLPFRTKRGTSYRAEVQERLDRNEAPAQRERETVAVVFQRPIFGRCIVLF